MFSSSSNASGLLRRLAPICFALTLSACGGGGGQTHSGGASTNGKSTDYIIQSNVDGANIAFTVHEPSKMSVGATYPIILQSHGFGGSREKASARTSMASLYKKLLSQGYGIVSIDERGHGDSGGTIRLLDPDLEGKDLIQILDWIEANIAWAAYRDGNIVLGATGGSYGGGFQHLIYAIDPKHRLDAIVPEITWNDLRFSLDSGDVFKSYWANLLSSQSGSNLDPEIAEGLEQGLSTGKLPQDKQDLLYNNSLASYCAGANSHGTLTRIDAMYWQSSYDTLFNLTDAYNNYTCVKALGGDVRFLSKAGGHDSGILGGPSGESCGRLNKDNAILAWFDEKLKGISGAASYIPGVCFNMGSSSSDGVVTDTFPLGGQSFQVTTQSLISQEGSTQSVSVLLTKISAGGAVLAGIPTINLTVNDPAGTNAGSPVIYIGLAKRKSGSSSDTILATNQLRPFRGFGSFDKQLIGVAARLSENDELRLVVQASNSQRYPGMGSSDATPITFTATVNVPLLTPNLPAPPSH